MTYVFPQFSLRNWQIEQARDGMVDFPGSSDRFFELSVYVSKEIHLAKDFTPVMRPIL